MFGLLVELSRTGFPEPRKRRSHEFMNELDESGKIEPDVHNNDLSAAIRISGMQGRTAIQRPRYVILSACRHSSRALSAAVPTAGVNL